MYIAMQIESSEIDMVVEPVRHSSTRRVTGLFYRHLTYIDRW